MEHRMLTNEMEVYIMGWTGIKASHYTTKGTIDRKAELDDELFRYGASENTHVLLKSSMVGAVYYAAVKNPLGDIYALVVISEIDNKDYFNFKYKDMSEDCGPCYYDCPVGILNMLTPTDNEWALQWREECRKKRMAKRSKDSISALPDGSVIRYTIHYPDKERTVTLTKCPPAYQFKRSYWVVHGENKYMPKTRIPKEYEIVRRGWDG